MLPKILIALFLMGAKLCIACSCELPGVTHPEIGKPSQKQISSAFATEYSRRATSIVRATVLAKKANATPRILDEKYQIAVLEVLKGENFVGQRKVIDPSGTCGFAINPGEEWIFFLHRDYFINQCTGNVQINITRAQRSGWTEKEIDVQVQFARDMLETLREAKIQDQLLRKSPIPKTPALAAIGQ